MKCDTPYYVMPKAALEKVPVPCGKCPACKKRRVDQWVFRLMEEEKVSSSAHFITLTYDTRHVPFSANGFMTLDRKEFPRFMKRLRKLTSNKLKYYAVGEYGGDGEATGYGRPHYHAIVFNVPDTEMYASAWSKAGKQFGTIHVDKVNTNTVAYTMKYIDKFSWKKKHGRDDRVPEFSLMSKGLGSSYIDRIGTWHSDDLSRMYVVKNGGFKVALPRYYRDKLLTDDEKNVQSRIIQSSVEKRETELVAELDRLKLRNRVPSDISVLEYERSKKDARYYQFYNRLKKRKL